MSQRIFTSTGFIQKLKSVAMGIKRSRRGRNLQRSSFWAGEALESRELLSSDSLGLGFAQYQAHPPQTRLTAESGFLTGPKSGQPLDIAIDYLKDYSVALGLTRQDIDSLEVASSYQSSVSQATHIYFHQVVNGIPVVNSTLNISITKNGEVISVGSSILPSVPTSTPAPNPQLSAVQALNSIVTSLGWAYEGTPGLVATTVGSATRDTLLASAGISRVAEIPASLRYLPRADGSLELTWLLNIQTTDGDSWYNAAVSSTSGTLLNLEDWVNQASYRAIEIPFETPGERLPAVIVDPQARSNASPFGWHDTDGVAGAEFTDTRGNNVFAQEDKDDNNTGGTRPDGGAGLVFDFPFDPTQGAQANESAAIVNLFYYNNVLHDVLYNYGFNEVAGNFQFNNYGKGGRGGDQVEADALDGSGTNNANFATPPDGISGRMQMFEFTFTTPTRDSDMDNFIIAHEFGHGLTNRLTGGPANSGALIQAQSRAMGEGWSDFLGLMFTQKTTDLQSGAYGVGNYVLGNPLDDPNGGIRDFPYSFDLTISPKTYGDFVLFSAPHPNGEIMAATLWDLNWLMINGNGSSIAGKGFEPDIYKFESGKGNTELMQIFVEALKIQPANPTYLDYRDAVLAADLALNGGENNIAIWTAFARRGMGFSANDGGSAASGDVEEAFDLPPGLLFEFSVTPNPVFENAGVGGANGLIKRPATSPINTAVTVSLTSSDVSEIRVPASVTIPSGAASVTFPVEIVDDNVLDGTQSVRLTATATIGGSVRIVSTTVNVLDHEALSITATPASIREDAGPNAATVTLTRFNTAGDLIVTLSNSDSSELSIPATVTIPDGDASVSFPVDAVDDSIRDGLQRVDITAVASRYQPNSATINVRDSEIIHVDVIADTVSEAAGPAATQVKVFRTDTDGPFEYLATPTYNNPNALPIPNNDRIYSPIIVPAQASRITDLDVTVNFQHQWLADLEVFLISPIGTRVKLFADLLSNGSQMIGTTFDDDTSLSILDGTAPFTGRFIPQGSLSKFNFESPTGAWLLEVVDDNSTDVGDLLGWSMTMRTEGLQELVVTLQSSNVGKASFGGNATTTVVIPANQSEAFATLDAVDNSLLDGDKVVTISAVNVNVAGIGLDSDTVLVTDREILELIADESVSEALIPATITGLVRRQNQDTSQPYTVQLSSSDTGRLTVPATVTIRAGKSSIEFPITVIDNDVVDGDVVVTLTATAPEYGDPVTTEITVLDHEPVLRLTTANSTVAENVGSIEVTVAREGIRSADLLNTLTVSLTALPGLNVPASVTIPAGQRKVTFSAEVVDNNLLDGTRLSAITASRNLYGSDSLDLTITDYESLNLTVSKTTVFENGGSPAAIGTVSRSNTNNLGQAVIVVLESSDVTELKVPASVTIPAGRASVTFFVEAVDDSIVDGSVSVLLTATSGVYVAGTVSVTVGDHEPPILTSPSTTTTDLRPRISWKAVSGTLRYDVWIDNLTTGVSEFLRKTDISTTFFVPPQKLEIGRYRVWVRAIDQSSRPGFWSEARDFFVNPSPTITSPIQGLPVVDGTFPRIVWSSVPGATKYEVWVDNITSKRIQVVNRTGLNALSTTSYKPTEVLGSGTYQIWVRGVNSKGEAGKWSSPVTYRVVSTPTITLPVEEGTFDRTPTFSWTVIPGATNYDIMIENSKTGAVLFRDRFVTTASYTVPQDLDYGEYRVQVRAQNGVSFGLWSPRRTLSVGLAPKITSAAVGTSGTPQFSWTAVAGAARYELWVSNMATNVRVIYQTNLKTTTYTSPTALPAGTYRVWIRAISTMGESTAWSSPVNLVIASQEVIPDSALPIRTAIRTTLVRYEESKTPDDSSSEVSVVQPVNSGSAGRFADVPAA